MIDDLIKGKALDLFVKSRIFSSFLKTIIVSNLRWLNHTLLVVRQVVSAGCLCPYASLALLWSLLLVHFPELSRLFVGLPALRVLLRIELQLPKLRHNIADYGK